MKCLLSFLLQTFLRISHVLELCAKLSPTDEEKHNENINLFQGWNPSMTFALRVLRNFSICICITLIIKITCDHWYFHCNVGFYCHNGPSYDARNGVRLQGVMRRFRSYEKVHIALQILILTCDWDEGEEGPLSWPLQANYKASRPNCKCNIASYVRFQKLCYNWAFNEWMV